MGRWTRMRRPTLALLCIAVVAVAGFTFFLNTSPPASVAPATPIQHVVIMMKENHAFDNYFGTFPEANGIPDGTRLPDGNGGTVASQWINGTSTPDLPHSRAAMLSDYDGGLNDRFVIEAQAWAPDLGNVTMGYYDARQLPAYRALAKEYVLADRYFSSMLGPTIPNRFYSLAGEAGGLASNDLPPGGVDIPTIFDQLESRGISWAYFYADNPLYQPLPLYFPRVNGSASMLSKVRPMDQLHGVIASGSLPAVAFVDPEGSLNLSEHPPANVMIGEAWTADLIQRIMNGPQWPSTSIFLTWDEGGGFYDHVPPPQVDQWGYGFRVPLLVLSPYAKRGFVDHDVMDHTSILKFIARNWNLPSLTNREAKANDLTDAFNFTLYGAAAGAPIGPLRLSSSMSPIASVPVARAFMTAEEHRSGRSSRGLTRGGRLRGGLCENPEGGSWP